MQELNALDGYMSAPFDHGGRKHIVYRRGSGPAVIVVHEMPGIHPLMLRFANRVVAAGMTVFLPSLFGTPGKPVTRSYLASELLKTICIRREFSVWSTGRSSPVVNWLRALARSAFEECGGQGVGAVGMCFTGGFALAMMTEPCVIAPVISQPSLPLAIGSRKRSADIHMSKEEVACVRKRLDREGLSAIGLRFMGDRGVPDERFATYKATFGSSFEAIELDPQDAAPSIVGIHSVLTMNLDDRPGSPTKRAEDRVISFLREQTGA